MDFLAGLILPGLGVIMFIIFGFTVMVLNREAKNDPPDDQLFDETRNRH